MTDESLVGRVIVVAGELAALADVAEIASASGAAVAVVSRTLPDVAAVRFRADAADPASWERIAMHVEQHLGPVDGVVTDESSYDAVRATFDADLQRRGHGHVSRLTSGGDAHAVLMSSVGRPPTTPAPPAPGEPDQ